MTGRCWLTVRPAVLLRWWGPSWENPRSQGRCGAGARALLDDLDDRHRGFRHIGMQSWGRGALGRRPGRGVRFKLKVRIYNK